MLFPLGCHFVLTYLSSHYLPIFTFKHINENMKLGRKMAKNTGMLFTSESPEVLKFVSKDCQGIVACISPYTNKDSINHPLLSTSCEKSRNSHESSWHTCILSCDFPIIIIIQQNKMQKVPNRFD